LLVCKFEMVIGVGVVKSFDAFSLITIGSVTLVGFSDSPAIEINIELVSKLAVLYENILNS